MKKTLLYFLPIAGFMTSCAQDAATGELRPTWVFWVFLGIIGVGLIFGVIVNSIRKKGSQSPEDETPRYVKQEEDYEKTLEHKEEKEEE